MSEDLVDGRGEEGLGKGERSERKVRREREGRVARRRVRETVEGWEGMFDGGMGGRYWWVGRVWRGKGSGWGGWGERKELCAKARERRARRTAGEVG